MKNIFKSVLALSLALVMLLALVSCDKSGSIKKAFEKEGYEVKSFKGSEATENDSVVTILDAVGLTEDQIKKIGEYELILVSKISSGSFGLVIKFPNEKDIKTFLTIGDNDTSLYDEAVKAGTINGNCIILTVRSSDKANDIFKNA